jgi:tetratricopeptide (TPR) repeat protein
MGQLMRPKVSLTMIVKDEEANLPTCLKTVADLVDESVIVDTGSTDRTREIAAGFGARVLGFEWVDDFSAARNESVRHATGRWILWFDADEWLDDENRRRLRTLLAGLGDENCGYVMQQLCTGQAALAGPPGSVDKAIPQVRLFRNLPGIHWEHRVYEQIVGSVRRAGGDLRQTDVVIQHPGYEDPEVHRSKIGRNMRLAHLELAEHPQGPYVLYIIGSFHQQLGEYEESLTYLRRCLHTLRPGASYAPTAFGLTSQALSQMGRTHEALALCRVGRDRYPDGSDLRTQEGLLLPSARDVAGAESFLDERLKNPGALYPALLEHELRTFARHHLAMLYRAEGRGPEAERLWQEALADSPRFALGWLELGELYVSLGRWPALEQVLKGLETHLGRTEDAAVLRARGHLARREFAAARALIEKVIALVPRSLRPRLVLSHVLLFEGRDPAAAEAALLDVLRLDPGNEQSLRNLEILRQSRPAAPRRDG